MNQVRHGLCVGGPKDRQTLATQQPGRVTHPDDPNGFYVYKSAIGTTPSQWLWIKTTEADKNK